MTRFRWIAIATLTWIGSLAAQEKITADTLASENPKEAGAAFANRVLLFPVTSFIINGLSGKYEHRLFNRHWGYSFPFYLGRLAEDNAGSISTLGAGFGIDWFLSNRPGGLRFSASFELLDFIRVDSVRFENDSDPTFANQSAAGADGYHDYAWTASVAGYYRWEYPSRRFLLDLGLGALYSRFSGPKKESLEPPPELNHFMPLVSLSFGFPF